MKTIYTSSKRFGRSNRRIVLSGMLSLCGLAALLAPQKSSGQLYTFSASGNATNPVTASVSFQTSGPTNDLLNIVLCSTSATTSRSDVLTAVYFGVTYTPTALALAAASGTVTPVSGADQPNTSLVADTGANKGKWTESSFSGLTNTAPGSNGHGLDYGIGTAGNSSVTNGQFAGSVVGNDDYTLIGPGTDRTISGLNNIILTRNCASFQLSGFAGHTVQQIDSVMVTWNSTGQYQAAGTFDPKKSTPEPGTWAMLCGISVGGVLALRKRRRRTI
ncbi:MAG: XDD4 family exosortase-dependent surface protein [Chthonomonadales bacterium]